MPEGALPVLRRCVRLLRRRVARLIELAFFLPFDACVLAAAPRASTSPRSAIVHVELLGDYVLWRPYGHVLARQLRAAGHDVAIVLERGVMPLAAADFPGCSLIGIGRRAMVRQPMQRAAMLRRLRALGVRRTIMTSHPRDALVHDAAVRALGAPAIGFDAGFVDRPALDLRWHRRLYARLLAAPPGLHQTQRHAELLRACGITERTAPSPPLVTETVLDAPYFVVAAGASVDVKRWPAARFIAAALHVLERRPHWRVVLLGAAAERGLGAELASALGERVIDLCGDTSLPQFAQWIAGAKLVLANDSAAAHFAAAAGVAAVTVVGGGQFARCLPYAPDTACLRPPTVVAEPMPCFGCDWMCRYRLSPSGAFRCIDAVSADAVCAALDAALDAD